MLPMHATDRNNTFTTHCTYCRDYCNFNKNITFKYNFEGKIYDRTIAILRNQRE